VCVCVCVCGWSRGVCPSRGARGPMGSCLNIACSNCPVSYGAFANSAICTWINAGLEIEERTLLLMVNIQISEEQVSGSICKR
jgi:hypothetical protein